MRKDKRQYERLSIPVTISYKRSEEREIPVRLLDISEGGLKIGVGNALEIGEKVSILLHIEDRKSPIIIKAEVIWSTKGGRLFPHGLKIYSISKKKKFVDFICRKSRHAGPEITVSASKERRRHKRIYIPVRIRCKLPRGSNVNIKGLDISGGGASLLTAQELRVGEEPTIKIYMYERKDPFVAKARIVWVKKRGGAFRCGLEFTYIKKQEEFAEFICDNIICKSLDSMVK